MTRPQRPASHQRLLAFWALLVLFALRAVMPSAHQAMTPAEQAFCLSQPDNATLIAKLLGTGFDAPSRLTDAGHHGSGFCDFCAVPGATAFAPSLSALARDSRRHDPPPAVVRVHQSRLAVFAPSARAPPRFA